MMNFQNYILYLLYRLLFFGLLIAVSTQKKSYDGYQMIRAWPQSLEHLRVLQRHYDDIDCCMEPTTTERSVDLLLHPHQISYVRQDLSRHQIKNKVVMNDVQSLIDSNSNAMKRRNLDSIKRTNDKEEPFSFKKYHRKREIDNYLDSLVEQYSPIMKKEVIGYSVEEREIPLVTLSKGEPKKRSIWIDGGIHAREWISPAVTLYLLASVLEDQSLLDTHDMYIAPLVNPDGYEYSHTDDRMWRKNTAVTPKCRGVDLNRNFDSHFGEEGSSSNPCKETYRGPTAFSEPEAQALRNAILARAKNMELYLTMHSYSQMLLIPYGYSSHPILYADNFGSMKRVAQNGTAALEAVNGKVFQSGNTARLVGAAAGGSDDWVKEHVGVDYVYTVELRDVSNSLDSSTYGFLLPATQIEPSGREMWACLKAMVDAITFEKMRKL